MQTPEQAAAEVALLTRQHRYLQKEFNGKLIFAPIELAGRDLKILDVGCGSGLVLNDLHSQVGAGSELVGLDMNPAALAQGQAAAASKGIKLIQHDINEPLPEDLKNKFDIVHVRYTIYGAGKSGIEATVKNVASALKSGGWLQIQEHKMTTGKGGEAFEEYVEYFNTLLGKMGFKPDFCDALKPAYEAAGLTDVKEMKDEPTFGKGTADDAESIEIFTAWVPVLQQFGEQLFQMSPKSPDLYEKLRAELAVKGASFTRYIVIGRKP